MLLDVMKMMTRTTTDEMQQRRGIESQSVQPAFFLHISSKQQQDARCVHLTHACAVCTEQCVCGVCCSNIGVVFVDFDGLFSVCRTPTCRSCLCCCLTITRPNDISSSSQTTQQNTVRIAHSTNICSHDAHAMQQISSLDCVRDCLTVALPPPSPSFVVTIPKCCLFERAKEWR